VGWTVGPRCQSARHEMRVYDMWIPVVLVGGPFVSGGGDEWDLIVRWEGWVGPTCQVGMVGPRCQSARHKI
jgi:hypothetical protein